MSGDSSERRVAPLKTYSRRVNMSLPVSASKNLSGKAFVDTNISAGTPHKRVLLVGDEDHQLEGNSDPRRNQQVDRTAPSTSAQGTQRQALLNLDPNSRCTNSSIPPLEQPQKRHSTSLQTSPSTSQRSTLTNTLSNHTNKNSLNLSPEDQGNSKPATARYSLSKTRKDASQGTDELLAGKTKRTTSAETFDSSHQASNDTLSLEPIIGLAKPSRKRQQPEQSESENQSMAKKAKHSSIKNYFKPALTSSSPTTTPSAKIFSDNLDPPSPPSSPPSSVERSKIQISRKKIRRRLSLKPSSPTPITLSANMSSDHNFKKGNKPDVREQFERLFSPIDDQHPVDTGKSGNGSLEENVEQNPRSQKWQAEGYASTGLVDRGSTENIPEDRVAVGVGLYDGVTHSDVVDLQRKRVARAPIKTQYHQLQFITERNPVIECSDCGYVYNRTINSEMRAHSYWHRDQDRGNRPTKSILGEPLWEQIKLDGSPHRIYASRSGASAKEREWFESALEVSMRRGLDGPSTEDLWTTIKDPAERERHVLVPKYKVFVYTIGVEVVSVILAERITRAGAFYHGAMTHDEFGKLDTPDKTKPQEYVNLDQQYPVIVSVDRIWTDARYRRKGYATKVLHVVRCNFNRNAKLLRCQVAFSVPTQDGYGFAKKYCRGIFAGDTPFVVNVDDARVVIENDKLTDKWAFSETKYREEKAKGGKFKQGKAKQGKVKEDKANESKVKEEKIQQTNCFEEDCTVKLTTNALDKLNAANDPLGHFSRPGTYRDWYCPSTHGSND